MNRMIHLRAFLLFALILQLSASTRMVFAGVIGSPHDLLTQGYIYTSEDIKLSDAQCRECHISPTDDRPLIWQMVPESIEKYGAAGIMCASCHDGVSMVDRNVDGGMTVFNPESHGFDPEQAPVDTDLKKSGLPYSPDNFISCLTCHDPHIMKYRPYLLVPLEGICQRCHLNRKHQGYGIDNTTGSHPVDIDPFDNTGGPSPIEVDADFAVPFPAPYPSVNAYLSSEGHWTLGGHLTLGSFGRITCSTCHSFHGVENDGPFQDLLSKDPVKTFSNEFCEGCHRGVRGDDKDEPPYPNPGGTITGRTYHPVDDDEANGAGWNVAIADTVERSYYEWGWIDPDTDRPALLCTTCHVAHRGMDNSPALVSIADTTRDEGEQTFCEVCHRDAPEGHHGYADTIITASDMSSLLMSNYQNLGHTFGTISYSRIYCSYCHKAHNAGYGGIEPNFIPILVDSGNEICRNCHELGVSHFMGDPTLSSTYEKVEPALYRGQWPGTGLYSEYEGPPESPTIITCNSCHYFLTAGPEASNVNYRLLAPAGEDTEWEPGVPEGYLCTGCHGEAPSTVGGGQTHPLLEADGLKYPVTQSYLDSGETLVSYTENERVNCHSCHRAHRADIQGGVYILKMGRGTNTNPQALQPKVDHETMCISCHSDK